MCTDQTKQEYIFLSSLGDGYSPVAKSNIISSMREINQDIFGNDRYLQTPSVLQDVFDSAVQSGFIENVNAGEWILTDKGIRRREFDYRNYIAPSLQSPA